MELTTENFCALLQDLKQWGDLELTYAGGGAHKRKDGGYLLQAELYLHVDLPNGDEVTKVINVLKGEIDLSAEEADSSPDEDEASQAPDQSQTAETDQES